MLQTSVIDCRYHDILQCSLSVNNFVRKKVTTSSDFSKEKKLWFNPKYHRPMDKQTTCKSFFTILFPHLANNQKGFESKGGFQHFSWSSRLEVVYFHLTSQVYCGLQIDSLQWFPHLHVCVTISTLFFVLFFYF